MNTSVEASRALDLVGLVQLLAAPRAMTAPGLEDAAERFAAFRGHPAVKTCARKMRHELEASGMLALFLAPPPALTWRVDPKGLSEDFFASVGGRPYFNEFLGWLRELSAQTAFSARWAELEGAFEAERARVERALGGLDPVAAVARYAREPLDARLRLFVSGLYAPAKIHSYIAPYPYGGPGVEVKGPFEVYHILGAGSELPKRPLDLIEPLYLILEPAFARHETRIRAMKSLAAGPRGHHGVTDGLAETIARRMERRPYGWPGPKKGPPHAKLTAALDAFEKGTETLSAYYPRLLDALE